MKCFYRAESLHNCKARSLFSAPSMSPEKVLCSAVSSTALKVIVEDPPLEGRHGVIQGYKVMHQLAQQLPTDQNSLESWDDSEDEEFPVEIKVTTSKTTIVSGLRVFRNYSVSALAFTTVGDGAASCQLQFCAKPTKMVSSFSHFKTQLVLLQPHSVILESFCMKISF